MSNYQANVIEVNIKYEPNKAPDYNAVGEQINEHLRKHFKGQKVVLHTISKEDHPGKSIEDVLEHLLKHGTDKPEEKSKGKEPGQEESYDFLGNYHEIHDKSDIMSAYAKDNNLKVDLVAVYDPEHVEKTNYADKSGVGDAYRFKQPEKKKAALKGVLKIVHEKQGAEEKGAEPNTAIKPKPKSQAEPEMDEQEIKQLAAELGLDYQGAN